MQQPTSFPLHNLRVPFVPSSSDAVNTMVELANIHKGEKSADLGSGDGRVVIAMAKKGAQAHGYEINKDLAIRAEQKIFEQELDTTAFIHLADYWNEDLSSYNVLTIYGMTSIMDRLEEKLQKELQPGTKVVSNVFIFPNWIHVVQKNNIYLYLVP